MKILDVTEFYSPAGGGVRRYLTEKARWLASHADVEHVVVVSTKRDTTEQWHRSRVYGVAGPSVPASPGYYFFVAVRKLARILNAERPDVIEVGSPYLTPWVVRHALRRGSVRSRLVGYMHEDVRAVIVGHGLRGAPGALQALMTRMVARYLVAAHRRFDLAIAATPEGADVCRAFGVPDVAVVPLGVDTTRFSPDHRDAAWKAEVGATPEQPVALYVGRLSTDRCVDVVLDALPAVHESTALRLVLIGDGHQRTRLERWAREHPGMLRVLPFEPNDARLARAYASADLYVAPGPYETFGLAAVEAMASGLPLVGVAAGRIGRLVSGVSWGRAYRRGDPGDCARALRELLEGGLSDAGRRARRAVLERYSWDRTFGELLARYRRLVSARVSQTRASKAAPSPAPSPSE